MDNRTRGETYTAPHTAMTTPRSGALSAPTVHPNNSGSSFDTPDPLALARLDPSATSQPAASPPGPASPFGLLSDSDYAALKASAISDAIISERGYRTIASAGDFEMSYAGEQYEGLWSRPTLKKIDAALLIPGYAAGSPSTTCVLRPHMPRMFADGTSPKYEYPPKQPPILDILPRYQSRLTDTTIPLWITEGAKKADALATLYDLAIVPASINGVYGWSKGGILKDFDAVILTGREVVLVPDGDISTKWAVAQAIGRLAHVLTTRGATVRLLLLPDAHGGGKVGIDDYIAAGASTDDLEARIQDWSTAIHTVVAGLKANGQGPASQQATIAEMINAWAAETDAWAYDPNRDQYMAWTGTHWEPARPMDVDAKISELLRAHGRDTKAGAANDIARFAKAKLARTFVGVGGLANFANGTFDLASGLLRPHDRADGLTYCLPFDFDPLAPSDAIRDFLMNTIPDPVARLCYMVHVGLALLGDTTRHAFIYLIGPPRAGKNTLLQMSNYATGQTHNPNDYADASLFSSETEGKRARFAWSQRRLVGVDEVKSEVALKCEDMIKKLSAHSGAEMRGMNKDEQTNNQWIPKLMFAANDAPRFIDNSGALQSRMHIVSCPVSRLGSEDFDLFTEKLQPQAGAFASLCLGLAVGILRCKLGMPISAKMIDERSGLADQNPLRSFVMERCVIGASERELVTSLYEDYKQHCDESGHKPMSRNRLLQALKDSGHAVEPCWMGNDRGYRGIRLLAPGETSYLRTNAPPTQFDTCVGAILDDWDAVKRAATYAPTYFSPIKSYENFAVLFSDVSTETHTEKHDTNIEKVQPDSCVGALVDEHIPLSSHLKPTYAPANVLRAIVGCVGNNGHEPVASPYNTAYTAHGIAVGPMMNRLRRNLSAPIPRAVIDQEAADLAAMTGGYDE